MKAKFFNGNGKIEKVMGLIITVLKQLSLTRIRKKNPSK